MTVESIQIRISEDGSRVVNRNLQQIGDTARKSADGVDFLKRALGALGAFLAFDKLKQYADTWAAASGQIRVATSSMAEAAEVTERLFKAAQNTRQPFEDMVQLYTRVARAGKELGTNQTTLIKFTEGIGKALAVQGGNAESAKGALLQLGQALGSGTVRAEEFNSVLEGAPYILQVVANNTKGVDGSIAKLRQRMLDGKLSSKEFFDAFLKGSKDIDADFAKSSLTISQSMTVITNALVRYVGELDTAIGFSQKFGEAAKFLANNLSSIVSVISAVAVGTGVYFALLKGAQFASAIAGQIQFVAAVAQGRAVMLGSAEAAAQMAAAQTAASLKAAQAAEAELAATQATNIAKLRSSVTLAEAKVAEVAATQAALVVAREEAVAKLAAANANIQQARTTIASAQAAGALSYALATARAATQELTVAEATRAAALRELALLGTQQARVSVLTTEALAAQTTATRALTAAQTQGAQAATAANAATAAAASAAATATAKAATASSALSRTLSALGIGALANPWILAAAAIATVITLIYKFGDAINIGLDDYTSLLDVFRSLWSFGVQAFTALKDGASAAFKVAGETAFDVLDAITGKTDDSTTSWLQSFSSFYSDVGSGWAGMVRGAAKTLDAIIGLFFGASIAIYRTYTGLPSLIGNIFKQVYNTIADWVEKALNAVIGAVNKIRGAIGASLLDTVSITRADVDKDAFEKYGQSIMSSIDDGFKAEGGALLKTVDAVFDRAKEIALQRAMEANVSAGANLDKKLGEGNKGGTDPKELDKLRNAYLSLLGTIDPVRQAELELAKDHALLNKAIEAGLVPAEKVADYRSRLNEKYQEALMPLAALHQSLNDEINLMNMSAQAAEVEIKFKQIQNELNAKGIKINNEEALSIRAKLIEMQKLKDITAAQDQLLANSVGKRKEFYTQLQAIMNLLSDPYSGFKKEDAQQAIVSQNEELFKGTQAAQEAQMASYKFMYEQIDAYRQRDLISEDDANRMRMKLQIKSNQEMYDATNSFLGDLSTLSKSGNKKLAEIGKAAAVAQATMYGYLSVQKALAEVPYPYNYAVAAAAATAAAANIADILSTKTGFKAGGYTGDMGRDEIAGVVHGREFVVNAEATSRNRPALEAMNRGESMAVGAPTTGMTVKIENYGTAKDFDVQQIGRDEVRIIARDEVRKVAPEVIASEFNNPNSRVSASANRNLQGGGRKR